MMKIYYSPKVTITCSILICLMLRASWWQYDRYTQKQIYITEMQQRLQEPIIDIRELLSAPNLNWDALHYRRVNISGSYDFAHEVVLRNRRYQQVSGVFALTPLKINLPKSNAEKYVLVSRGFIPISKANQTSRKQFQIKPEVSFIGLIKESSPRKMFAPQDPPAGLHLPWVDAWLRIDIDSIAKQMPYPILPVYLEIMDTGDIKGVEEKIVTSTSGREELFFLPGKEANLSQIQVEPDLPYPIPIYDTVIPAGRHFGYIFEWAIMALFTALAGLVLQLRPRRNHTPL